MVIGKASQEEESYNLQVTTQDSITIKSKKCQNTNMKLMKVVESIIDPLPKKLKIKIEKDKEKGIHSSIIFNSSYPDKVEVINQCKTTKRFQTPEKNK